MFRYNNISLRSIQEYDLGKILEWRNSQRVRENMFTDHIITIEEHRLWYKNLLRTDNVIYRIVEMDNTPIGVTYFTDIDYINSRSYWGFYLGHKNLPKGTGSIMGFISMLYAFEVLKLRKVCGEVFDFNIASNAIFKKLGFKEEGILREHVLKNKKHEDLILYGLLKNKWFKNCCLLEKNIFKDRYNNLKQQSNKLKGGKL